MTFQNIDLTGFSSDADLEGARVPPGWYHLQVLDVRQDDEGRTPCLVFKLGVLAGEHQGVTFPERLYFSDKDGAKRRVGLFARRLGLVRPEDLGKRVSIDWRRAAGRDFVAEVIEETFEKRDGSKGTTSKISFGGVYDPADERVKDVPRGKVEAVAPAPVAPADDDFSDL
jgi:hypothetical protein